MAINLSRISNKVYSEPLMHTLSPCEGPIESIFNFILIPHSVLCIMYVQSWTQLSISSLYFTDEVINFKEPETILYKEY